MPRIAKDQVHTFQPADRSMPGWSVQAPWIHRDQLVFFVYPSAQLKSVFSRLEAGFFGTNYWFDQSAHYTRIYGCLDFIEFLNFHEFSLCAFILLILPLVLLLLSFRCLMQDNDHAAAVFECRLRMFFQDPFLAVSPNRMVGHPMLVELSPLVESNCRSLKILKFKILPRCNSEALFDERVLWILNARTPRRTACGRLRCHLQATASAKARMI